MNKKTQQSTNQRIKKGRKKKTKRRTGGEVKEGREVKRTNKRRERQGERKKKYKGSNTKNQTQGTHALPGYSFPLFVFACVRCPFASHCAIGSWAGEGRSAAQILRVTLPRLFITFSEYITAWAEGLFSFRLVPSRLVLISLYISASRCCRPLGVDILF